MEGFIGYEGSVYLIDPNEKRRIRPYALMYHKGLTYVFPTDTLGMSKIKASVIAVSGYCLLRVNEKGYVEKEMVVEMYNIGRVLRAYCEINEGEYWKDFYLFFIRYFEYLLREGLKYDKNLIIELFIKSGIIASLSIFITQYKTYIFSSHLILDYYDTSVEKEKYNILCFITNQLFPGTKEVRSIKMETLSMYELENAIRFGYYNDRKKELGEYLRGLLLKKKRTDEKDYENLRVGLLKLHIMQELDISLFEDLLTDHELYDLMYHPRRIDFNKINLAYFSGLRNVDISNIAIKYGGYDFYLRIGAEKKKDKNIGKVYTFIKVLTNDDFKRRYYEEVLVKEKKHKKEREREKVKV